MYLELSYIKMQIISTKVCRVTIIL